MKNISIFEGPLFIVGVPRSGTKLLLALLNSHSLISLPSSECQFIPDFIKWRNTRPENPEVDTFISRFKRTKYFDKKGSIAGFKEELIKDYVVNNDIDVFIESILKYYSVKFEGFGSFKYIWGDKTPLYIKEIDTLRQVYPNAKFIHILRDPRDVALSYKKTWGKSLLGSAEKWRSIMEDIESKKYTSEQWFFEIKYESLITSTDEVLREVCSFLQIPFETKMTILDKSIEKFGDANKAKISKGNTKKYLDELNQEQIKSIESITKPHLLKKGYELESIDIEHSPLNRFQVLYYKIVDYIRFLRHHYFQEDGMKGVFWNLRTLFRKYR